MVYMIMSLRSLVHNGQVSRPLPKIVQPGFSESLGRATLERSRARYDGAAALLYSLSESLRSMSRGIHVGIVRTPVEDTFSERRDLGDILPTVSQDGIHFHMVLFLT